MTRTKRLLSMILALALVWVVLTPAVQAEPQTVLEQMMQQVDLPITYDLHAMPTQAGEDDTQKELALTFAAQDGQSVHVRVQMLVQGVTKLDNQWAALSEPYAEVVSSLVAGHEIDDSLPAQIDQQLKMRIAQQKQAPMAQADDAEAPAPALSGDITIAQVSVTHPYYETLQNGSKGPAAEKLQKQLMDLGFLDGEPDGQFGPKTKVGVEALQ
ncbi:peptidoglycan-binding protein, partial [Eubacteriales bacterium OttesenSCG-928-N13]|nr:peptidoglycan-binding protein [Eubacteriales bacterium OttesenSCG-928-N13]